MDANPWHLAPCLKHSVNKLLLEEGREEGRDVLNIGSSLGMMIPMRSATHRLLKFPEYTRRKSNSVPRQSHRQAHEHTCVEWEPCVGSQPLCSRKQKAELEIELAHGGVSHSARGLSLVLSRSIFAPQLAHWRWQMSLFFIQIFFGWLKASLNGRCFGTNVSTGPSHGLTPKQVQIHWH